MPTKGSCLKLITSGFRISKVKRITSKIPSKDKFLLFLYYTSAGLHCIRSCNFTSIFRPGKIHHPFPRGARTHNNGYYVFKLNNTRWWFQLTTKIFVVGLIVLMGSSWLSNRWIRCIVYILQQQWDHNIWCVRILQCKALIAYGLWIIMLI
jgi:hypothetical protein